MSFIKTISCTLISSVMIFSSFQMNVFSADAAEISGDVNNDGRFDENDAALLQKWLIFAPDAAIKDAGKADINSDGSADIFDLITMKQNLLYGTPDNTSDEGTLIEAPVSLLDASLPSVGNAKMLMVYVDFADVKYRPDAYSNEFMENELFGEGTGAAPYESVSTWFERSSFGNLHIDGDVYHYTCSGKMSDYMKNEDEYEPFAMEVMKGLDSQIDFSDYDENHDGVIDAIAFTVPLDYADEETKYFWYGNTSTWYDNPYFSVDNMRVNKFIIMDVMPNKKDLRYLKQTLIHEMGHCMGLPDYYPYFTEDEREGFYGDAGDERMDDSYGDFCSYSKLLLGWLKDTEIQSYSGSGTQTFLLDDASQKGSCLILPISSEAGDYLSEYFLVEYITKSGNNADMFSRKDGVRIFHIQSEFKTDFWGNVTIRYQAYSMSYMGDDKIRVARLVNDNNGFYKSGDTVRFGTTNFAAYDKNGYQTIDTGYTVKIGEKKDGKYEITVTR